MIYSELGMIFSLCYYKRGEVLIGGSKDGAIGLWDANSGELIRSYKDHNSIVTSMGIDNKRNLLVSAGFDNKIVVRNLETGEKVSEIDKSKKFKTGGIAYSALSPDGMSIVFGQEKSGIYLWDMSKKSVDKII